MSTHGAERTNQKLRTRTAVIDAGRRLVGSGQVRSIADIAREALVSEATVYRYFPDAGSVLVEAMRGLWPGPATAMGAAARSDDPTERLSAGVAYYARHVLTYQGALRGVVAASLLGPGAGPARAEIRDELFDAALEPLTRQRPPVPRRRLAQLRRDLMLLTSTGGLLALLDRQGLEVDEVVAIVVDGARGLMGSLLP